MQSQLNVAWLSLQTLNATIFVNLLTKHIFSSHSPPFWQLQILLLLASKRTADLVKHDILAHRYGQMNRADNTHLLFISLKDLA